MCGSGYVAVAGTCMPAALFGDGPVKPQAPPAEPTARIPSVVPSPSRLFGTVSATMVSTAKPAVYEPPSGLVYALGAVVTFICVATGAVVRLGLMDWLLGPLPSPPGHFVSLDLARAAHKKWMREARTGVTVLEDSVLPSPRRVRRVKNLIKIAPAQPVASEPSVASVTPSDTPVVVKAPAVVPAPSAVPAAPASTQGFNAVASAVASAVAVASATPATGGVVADVPRNKRGKKKQRRRASKRVATAAARASLPPAAPVAPASARREDAVADTAVAGVAAACNAAAGPDSRSVHVDAGRAGHEVQKLLGLPSPPGSPGSCGQPPRTFMNGAAGSVVRSDVCSAGSGTAPSASSASLSSNQSQSSGNSTGATAVPATAKLKHLVSSIKAGVSARRTAKQFGRGRDSVATQVECMFDAIPQESAGVPDNFDPHAVLASSFPAHLRRLSTASTDAIADGQFSDVLTQRPVVDTSAVAIDDAPAGSGGGADSTSSSRHGGFVEDAVASKALMDFLQSASSITPQSGGASASLPAEARTTPIVTPPTSLVPTQAQTRKHILSLLSHPMAASDDAQDVGAGGGEGAPGVCSAPKKRTAGAAKKAAAAPAQEQEQEQVPAPPTGNAAGAADDAAKATSVVLESGASQDAAPEAPQTPPRSIQVQPIKCESATRALVHTDAMPSPPAPRDVDPALDDSCAESLVRDTDSVGSEGKLGLSVESVVSAPPPRHRVSLSWADMAEESDEDVGFGVFLMESGSDSEDGRSSVSGSDSVAGISPVRPVQSPVPSPPVAPSTGAWVLGVVATPCDSSVRVEWLRSDRCERERVSFVVEASPSDSGDNAVSPRVTTSRSSAVVEGLSNGTEYSIRVSVARGEDVIDGSVVAAKRTVTPTASSALEQALPRDADRELQAASAWLAPSAFESSTAQRVGIVGVKLLWCVFRRYADADGRLARDAFACCVADAGLTPSVADDGNAGPLPRDHRQSLRRPHKLCAEAVRRCFARVATSTAPDGAQVVDFGAFLHAVVLMGSASCAMRRGSASGAGAGAGAGSSDTCAVCRQDGAAHADDATTAAAPRLGQALDRYWVPLASALAATRSQSFGRADALTCAGDADVQAALRAQRGAIAAAFKGAATGDCVSLSSVVPLVLPVVGDAQAVAECFVAAAQPRRLAPAVVLTELQFSQFVAFAAFCSHPTKGTKASERVCALVECMSTA